MAKRAGKAPEGPRPEPPYYEATADLFFGVPGSGAMPVRAYSKGSQVFPDAVRNGGWADQVKVPDHFTEQFGTDVPGASVPAEQEDEPGEAAPSEPPAGSKTVGEQHAEPAGASSEGNGAAPAAEEGSE